ncbi:ABC transporter permease [Brevibacterium sp. 50QC2O2]|uniref:ABC transporter permease n=1 Tax=Brevibacterium TaxID=1696 RepID=UPI00211CA4FA|nr:ABC transporter permease [Brevibacterium sp. 91QC2O2]MCQ9386334.1 ABC transporter permease [Brevibacterium sp. 68QC2CO]MCQ9389469.1 ABC transporter permease [Brevibacterium sp. 50QC2O2]
MNRALSILRFLAARAGGAVLVLLIIATISFAIFYLLPNNPAQLSCGKPCTPDRLAEVQTYMGLDKPWYAQLGAFLLGIVAGRTFGAGATAIHCAAPCFGYSFRLQSDVTGLLGERLPVTLSIAIGAIVLWTIAGVGAGVWAALKRGKPTDRLLMGASVFGVSAPSYLVALLLILLFGFTLNVLPIGGYVAFTENPAGWAYHLIMPWVALAIINAAIYTRLTRGTLLETLGQDFVRTARAIGLRESAVVVRHGLRNMVVPIATLIALDFGSLLGGTVITEKVFNLAGVGSLLLDAVNNLDLQVVVGVTLFAAAAVIVANFLIDILYSVLDPRIGAHA